MIKRMIELDIHADDYALTLHTSYEILECMKEGKLDSISVMVNMSCAEECMDMLINAIPELPFLPRMSIHLDFVEGKCLAGSSEVPLLVRENSDYIGLSWGNLLALSYHPGKRRAAKEQLKKEIRAQLAAGRKAIARCMEEAEKHQIPCEQRAMRIDSHQHTHMIPVVWKALTEVIAEENYTVEYIRNSKEALDVFLTKFSLWKTYRPINFVKNRVLSLFSGKVDRYMKKHSMPPMYFWGLIMSGYMDYERIIRLYSAMEEKARKGNRRLELCFHPGRILSMEITEEIDLRAVEDFYLHPDRMVEKETVMRISYLRRKIL